MPLSVKDGMGAWIKDFQDSNAPQFKGKSDKERREMAMAAYLSAKKESVDEAKRTVTIDTPDRLTSMRVSKDKPPFDPDPPKAKQKNSDDTKTSPMSRAKQLAKMARDRGLKKEEVEEAYKTPAEADAYNTGKKAVAKRVSYDDNPHKKGSKEHTAWSRGHNDARASLIAKRHTKESVELDENIIAKRAYEIMKPTKSMNHGIEAIKKTMKVDHGTATRLAKQVMDKVKKGEFKESIDEAGSPERYKMIKKAGDKYNKEKKKAERDAMKAMSKDKDMMGEAKLDELSPATHKSYQAKAFTSGAAGMAAKRMGTMSAKDAYDNEKKRHAGIELSKSLQRRDARKKRNEETVSELKKSTLGSYVKKAAQDAGAKAYSAAQKATSNPDQSGKDYVKSVKRQKGIARATDKLTKEAKSFDQKFRDHLKFSTSKSPAVQAYMKKRVADRDAMNKANDPNAAKKGYALSAVPPERAFKKARKKGMSASDASQAVGTASRNRGRKLPK